ncbi:hypothetical protein ACHAQA_004566 [Verticillium albo-atrum]
MSADTPAVRPHIAIIGAGVSGLRCADVLLSQGYEVTILEARSRIGGRVSSPNLTDGIGPGNRLIQNRFASQMTWEEAFNFSADAKDGSSKISNDASLYDFIRDKSKEKLSDEQEQALLLKMSEMFGAYIGEPVWRQSLKFAWLEECCGGAKVAQPALAGTHVVLDTYVESVSTPERREPGGKVKIGTKSGQFMEFDEVVVTTPLGWLKRNHRAFEPQLPPQISKAIENISLSQLEKVFITFPSVFWNKSPELNTFPCYANWLTPEYAEESNPEHWPQEIWDLSSFTPPNNHPTILFYTYGDCSRHIVNKIADMSREEEFSFLDTFFRPYYSRLPGYAADNENCKPKAILATKWLKDDLSGNASYCNFQVGVQNADKDVLSFRQGCPDRRLWFCGEHAAPFDECGTVAGAYLSGEAAGKKIIQAYA